MTSKENILQFAEYVINTQNLTLLEKDNFNIALDIRKDDQFFVLNVFEKVLLNNKTYFNQIDWSKWKIYFVSEILTPFDSLQNHYNHFKKVILDPMVHKYGHLNLGPTVMTINENLLDSLDSKHANKNHLIDEYTELLPKSFDLMILSPYIELDMSSNAFVISHENEQIFLNLGTFRNAKKICFIINDKEDVDLFEPESNYKLITNKFTAKAATFLISKIHTHTM